MKVTIKDIAAATGFSPATISLVLNDRPCRISKETRAKIFQTATELGYHPNAAAVSLKTNRSHTLGLIVPEFRNDFHATYAAAMEEVCKEKGWSMILCSTNFDIKRERSYIENFAMKNIDGICISSTPDSDIRINHENIQRILSLNIPLVLKDMTFFDPRANVVCADHEKGGYMATSHLLSLGHTSIAFITGPLDWEGAASRLKGCKKAFDDYGLKWDDSMVYTGDYSYKSGINGIDYLCDKRFTAVFAFNDMMALGVYNGLSKYNLSVPEDVSIIGYDDLSFSKIINVPLTTIRQPIEEMGRKAAELLINAAENPDTEPIISKHELNLIVRNSTKQLSV